MNRKQHLWQWLLAQRTHEILLRRCSFPMGKSFRFRCFHDARDIPSVCTYLCSFGQPECLYLFGSSGVNQKFLAGQSSSQPAHVRARSAHRGACCFPRARRASAHQTCNEARAHGQSRSPVYRFESCCCVWHWQSTRARPLVT